MSRFEYEIFFFFFFNYRIVNGAYVWVCVSVLFPRIEPVGKPYREVCLRSELWPWTLLDGLSTEFLVETSRDTD